MIRLTSTDAPTDTVEKELFHDNLCAELQQVLTQVEAGPDPRCQGHAGDRNSRTHHIEWILSCKRELRESAEVALSRIRGYTCELYIVIDEPYLFMEADNFFRRCTQDIFITKPDLMATCCDKAVRRKYWETIIPTSR